MGVNYQRNYLKNLKSPPRLPHLKVSCPGSQQDVVRVPVEGGDGGANGLLDVL